MNKKVNFDEYVNNYNELLHQATGFFSSSEEYFAKYKIDFLEKCVSEKPTRILEYGCGIGRNIIYLKKSFPNAEIIGTDISAASLELAAVSYPEGRFEIERDDLDIGLFDLIFVAGVFHHVPVVERVNVASILNQRLLPGGDLVVFEHNPYNPVTRRIVKDCPYDADAILLSPSELINYLEQAGFRMKKKSYCLFVPPKLCSWSSLDNYLSWLPLGGQYCIQATS